MTIESWARFEWINPDTMSTKYEPPLGYRPSYKAMSPSQERMFRSTIKWLTEQMVPRDELSIILGDDGRYYHKITRTKTNLNSPKPTP